MRWIDEIAAACVALACAWLFVAAADERGGRRFLAWRRARRAGFLAGAAGAVQLVVAPWLAWSARRAPWLALAVAASALCAATVLLAGLARKPRPSCWLAAGAWLLATGLRLGARPGPLLDWFDSWSR